MSDEKHDDGGQAFPMADRDDSMKGMTLEDWFAGQALTGLLEPTMMGAFENEQIAKSAYDLAAAMVDEMRRRENAK